MELERQELLVLISSKLREHGLKIVFFVIRGVFALREDKRE